jgi:hypothetical protein
MLAFSAVGTLLVMAISNRGPDWRLVTVTGDGVAVVNGRPVPLRHRDDLARALRPGARVRIGAGAAIEVETRRGLILGIEPGTDFTLPASAGRWFGTEIRAVVRQGEIRITTGPAFLGNRLLVKTRETEIAVDGTTLSVISEPAGTWVRVLEGMVLTSDHKGRPIAIPRGRRRLLLKDGGGAEDGAIDPQEQATLGAFRLRHRQRLESVAR